MLYLVLLAFVLLGFLRTHLHKQPPGYVEWITWYGVRARDILDETGALYLRKYCLADWHWVKVYVHFIAQADHDRALHNHPWRWARSFILNGGYTEERPRWLLRTALSDPQLLEDCPRVKYVVRGDWNALAGSDFHRISQVLPDTYTLFIVGPRAQTWGFLTRTGFVEWKKYLGLPQ